MKRTDMFSTAGWLFADLLLVLAVIFLVMGAESPAIGSGGMLATVPTPSTAPTYTPYPTQTPLPTYTPFPTRLPQGTVFPTAVIGLDTTPVYIYIRPGDDFETIVSGALEAYPDRVAGFVLVFGYSNDVGTGVGRAREAFKQLTTGFPQAFPAGTPNRPLFWNADQSGPEGTIRVEIFFISELDS